MKNSKSFFLLIVVTILIIAVSACAVIPSQTGGSNYNGTTVIATVYEIDGDKLTLGIQQNNIYYTVSSNYGGSLNYYTFSTMSVQDPSATISRTYEYDFTDMSLSTNMSVYHEMPMILLKTFTAAPEMLEGISVHDVVEVTFDENENVIRIKKRASQAITAEKDGKSTVNSTAAQPQKPSEK